MVFRRMSNRRTICEPVKDTPQNVRVMLPVVLSIKVVHTLEWGYPVGLKEVLLCSIVHRKGSRYLFFHFFLYMLLGAMFGYCRIHTFNLSRLALSKPFN